jgi:hypothetical protein
MWPSLGFSVKFDDDGPVKETSPLSSPLRRFRRRPEQAVAAVQLKLDTDGLRYRKWGDEQRAKAGDWLVDNDGDVYTVSADTFARTYRQVTKGAYVKSTPVWGVRAATAGRVSTQEGASAYQAGDWLVSNQEDGGDAYAVAADKFESLYEPDE